MDQDSPVPSGQVAAAAVHAAGLLFVSAPALDLEQDNTSCTGPSYACFLAQDLAGKFAAFSNVIDLQAQSLETTPGTYLSFVQQTAAQARAANPNVIVLAGLSTSPDNGAYTPTVAQLSQDVSETRGLVPGYWMNIPDGNSALAISVMKSSGV